ncbi:hypothetical protein EI94DRAFT_817892 [Lactarius quietus]|nr:hypothetical protein EI94DRAFT_817892 [Lactarius quietus]
MGSFHVLLRPTLTAAFTTISPPKVRHRPPGVVATNVARGVCTVLASFPSTLVATWEEYDQLRGEGCETEAIWLPFVCHPSLSFTGPRHADLRFWDRIDLREPAAGRTSRSSRNPADCVMPTPNAQRPEPFLCEGATQMGPPTAGEVKACAVWRRRNTSNGDVENQLTLNGAWPQICLCRRFTHMPGLVRLVPATRDASRQLASGGTALAPRVALLGGRLRTEHPCLQPHRIG